MSAPRTSRGNRLGMGLVGIVLLVAGGYVTARSVGVSGLGSSNQDVLTASITRTAHDSWFAPVAGVVAGVIALLCVRWLLVQLRTTAVRRVSLEPDPLHGTTVVTGAALAAAVEAEIAAYPDVTAARASLVGSRRSPELHLDVTVPRASTLEHLSRRIHDEAVAHARTALDRPALPVLLEITVR